MSKRAGDFILAKDLIDAVGKDSVRFMMVYRSSNSQLDFDFDLVTDTSKDNPIFLCTICMWDQILYLINQILILKNLSLMQIRKFKI